MFANDQPIVNVELPPPIMLSSVRLVGMHLLLLSVDYLASRHERHLPTLLQGASLRIVLATIHFMMPLTFASPNFYLTAALIGAPWFIGAKIVQHSRQPLPAMLRSMMWMGRRRPQDDVGRVRMQGLAKVARGIFKWAFMKAAIDPLLPANYGPQLLALPYWSSYSLWLTAVLGIKVYCLCALADLSMGLQQFLIGVPFMDMFDSPLLAHSPRDFWSRRWNLPVKTLLHQQFFRPSSRAPEAKPNTPPSPSSRIVRGLFIFFVSGVFHEVMLATVVRKVTLEQILFFTIHGALVLIEVQCFPEKTTSVGWMRRALYMAINLAILTLTGRLFLAPYIRSDLITHIFG